MIDNDVNKFYALGSVIEEFLSKYLQKGSESNEAWLYDRLAEYCPNLNKYEVGKICENIHSDNLYIQDNLCELKDVENKYGWNAEMWLYHSIIKGYNGDEKYIWNLKKANNILKNISEWKKQMIKNRDDDSQDDIFNGLNDEKIYLDKSQQIINDAYCVDINDLAIKFSRNAVANGAGNISIIGNISINKKTAQGLRKVESEEIISILKNQGAEIGIRNALTGALKVGAERNLIPLLGKGAPLSTLETLSYFAVENSKIVWDFANNEIPLLEAVDRAGRISVSCVFSAKGMMIGATMGTVVPVVGPVVGGLLGKFIGETVARKGGVLFYDATSHLAWCAADIALSRWNILDNTEKVINKILLKI